MADQKTIKEIRNEIRDNVDGLSPVNRISKRPFRKEELRLIAKELTGEEPSGSISHFRYTVAQGSGIDLDPIDAGTPFTKQDVLNVLDAVKGDGDDEAWDMIGSAEVGKEKRELSPPDPDSRRFEVLQEVAANGPGTLEEIATEADVEFSTVESELTRLYRTKMVERSKRPGFDDVYTYWISLDGTRCLRDNEAAPSEEGWTQSHKELDSMYGTSDDTYALSEK